MNKLQQIIKINALGALIILTISCHHKDSGQKYKFGKVLNNQKPTKVFVDIDKVSTINFSDIFESIELIPLETNEECLLGERNFINVYDDNIYVHSEDGNGIFIFDNKGAYVNRIFSIGKGPGEYTKIYDVFIDGDSIMLLTYMKMMVFDKMGCKFTSEKKMSEMLIGSIKFHSHKNKYYMFSFDASPGINLGAEIYRTKSNLELEKAYISPQHNVEFRLMNVRPFYELNGELFFQEALNDTIYKVIEDGLVPSLYVKYSAPSPTIEVLEKCRKANLNRMVPIPDKYINKGLDYIVSNDVMMGTARFKKEDYSFVHWFCQDKTITFKNKDIKDDILGFMPFAFFNWGKIIGDYIYCTIPTVYVIDYCQQHNIKVPEGITDINANPILVKAKLRKKYEE